mmetsp:Transcript_130241/g.225184  ORF Transcript_130241/g.225184 Transcript_130241/m.225184 type:complete len:92 (+) Transcript_130241:89-364(+)
MEDNVLPSLLCNDDDRSGVDDDFGISDGEAGHLAGNEDEAEQVTVALLDDLCATIQQVESLQGWSEAQCIADGAAYFSGRSFDTACWGLWC